MFIKKTSPQIISNKIVVLNFILSIMIVIYHSDCKRAMHYDNFDLLYYVSESISKLFNLAVPSFFFISSFLFYRNFKNSTYIYKLKSRFKSLVIPYIFWNLFYCILFILISNISFLEGHYNTIVTFNIAHNIIGICTSQYTPLWFVLDLIIYTLLSPFILFIIENKKISILLIIILIYFNLCIDISYKSCFYWAPIYLTGAILGKYYSNFVFTTLYINRHIQILAFILLITFSIFQVFNTSIKITYLYRIISPFLFWILVDAFLLNKKNYIRNPKGYFHYSFFIYANHFFFITAIQKMISWLNINPTLSFILSYAIIPPIIIFYLIKCATFLQKRCNKVYSLITGGR